MPDLRERLGEALGGNYTVERELGGAGMSRVFVAQDNSLDRSVVVKVLHSEIAAEVSTERFRREVQVAARLQHPHIVPLLSSGEVDRLPYYLMPYVDGESLRARLMREGELPLKEATRILRDVASALAHAHRHGVVHRDIKPDNVLLSEDFALVTDFGIAKAISAATKTGEESRLTTVGVALGTPAYMAPEQAAGETTVDQRADIYSFGVVAYEVLTGSHPFAGRTNQAVIAAHAVQIPESIERRRPGLPQSLVSLVMQCLEKRPADRPQNTNELLEVLDSIPTSGPTTVATGIVPRSEAAPKPRPRKMIAGIAGIAILAAVTIGYLIYSGKLSMRPGNAGAPLRSIAVLPLVNLSGNNADEYFSDGMTDELANALSKIPNLSVASRTSAYAFKGRKNLDLADVGKKLNVRAVVEGSVRRAGNRLRVNAQLTDIENGFVLWSDTYEGDANDVFRVQDNIATSVADALRSRLTASAATLVSEARGTQNLRAYDLYLRGRYFWFRRGDDNLRRAISYFESALREDEKFARAYAGLAITYALLPEYSSTPVPNAFERTQDAASRALDLDSTLAEPHAALGLALIHAWQREKAASEYRKAIALDPKYPTAHQWYGEYWYQIGQIDSSLAQIRTAAQLDPLAPINASALCYVLTLAGKYDEAIAEAKKGIELAPSLGLHHAMLSEAYFAKGDRTSALDEALTAALIDSGLASRQALLAFMYASAGRQAEATRMLDVLKTRAKSASVSPYSLAIAYLGVGDKNAALTELERAVREHDLVVAGWSLSKDPMLAPLRGDARFKRLLVDANVAQ